MDCLPSRVTYICIVICAKLHVIDRNGSGQMPSQALNEDARRSKHTFFKFVCLCLSVSLSLSLFPSLSNILFRHKLLTSMRRLEILCRYRVYIDTNLDGTSDGEIYPGFGRLMGHMCTLPETKRKHEELAMTRIL